MKILVAEDDASSRNFLFKFLSKYGECDLVIDGLEALDAYLLALKEEQPYDLIFLDIMMPKVDGVKVLKAIRDYENKKEMPAEDQVKVVMTTALAEAEFVHRSFEIGCEAYAGKPIDIVKLENVLTKLGYSKKSDD